MKAELIIENGKLIIDGKGQIISGDFYSLFVNMLAPLGDVAFIQNFKIVSS